MNEYVTLTTALVAGLALGAMFFGGLWWTVGKALASPRPSLWFLSSMLLRTAVTLGGFYLVSGGHSTRLLVCLLGFVTARYIVTRLTAPPAKDPGATTQEAGHAP